MASILTSAKTSSQVSSLSTPSVSPSSNNLILASVASCRADSTTPNKPGISGNGLTWHEIDSINYDTAGTSRRRVTWFWALGASPSAGAITADFSGQNQDEIVITVDTEPDVDTVSPIVQAVPGTDTSGSSTSMTINLAAFSSPSNRTYGSFASNGSGTTSAGSGFSKVNEATSDNAPIVRATTQYRSDNDTTVNMTFSSATEIGGIAIEIAAPTVSSNAKKINIGDSWKDVSAMKINIGDSWKDVVAIKQNIGDSWHDVF